MLYLPLIIVISALAADPSTTEPSRAALEQRIAELETTVQMLEEALEPTTPPTNLARTSLAEVAASSVNGSRTLVNPFYGVRNAFDGGENWINNINYTSWLGTGSTGWIEIYFAEPVTVRAADIHGPGGTMRLFGVNDGEFDAVEVHGREDLPTPVRGVVRVRFEFGHSQGGGNVQVSEIRVFGDPPPGVAFDVQTPLIRMNARDAMATATDRFQQWQQQLFQGTAPRLEETDAAWTFTFVREDVPCYRVTIRKSDQVIEETSLVTWAPVADPLDE